MLRDGIEPKHNSKLAQFRESPETWVLAASIVWCAVLGCGLVYVILVTVL
jgi:hypothetical protein